MIALTEQQRAIVEKILQQHVPNKTVWVFGSRVTAMHKKYSDLDLAIIAKKPIPILTLALLKDAFSESDLPFKVDIIDWANTSGRFRKIIYDHHVALR